MQGRTVLVTGGTGALGLGVVRVFLAGGATVHTSWISEREADALRAALGPAHAPPGRLHLHEADVTEPAAVEALVADVVAASGRLDVLAHLVGGFAYAPVTETDPATWQKMIALNATSTFLCARAAAGAMKRQRWGRIIAVTAVPAVERGAARMSAYAASKAAVKNLVETLASELAGDGITVNAIAPTIIDTPANRAAMPDADTSTWLAPDAIGAVLEWLAGDDAGIVTGTTLMLARSG